MKLVDDAVRRVLRVKFALGLFDDPYRYCDAAREKAGAGSTPRTSPRRATWRASRSCCSRTRAASCRSTRRVEDDRGHRAARRRQGLAARQLARAGRRRTRPSRCSRGSRPRCRPVDAGRPRRGREARHRPAQLHGAAPSTTRPTAPASRRRSRPRAAPTSWCWRSARTRSSPGEGRSQADIGLKGLQEELLEAVVEANKKVVVVLMNGRPLDPSAGRRRRARHRRGVARAARRPATRSPTCCSATTTRPGKLPVAFPRSVGQLPMTYAHKNTGRPGPRAGRDVVALHRRAERPALPVRLRPQLHDLHVLGAEGERRRRSDATARCRSR